MREEGEKDYERKREKQGGRVGESRKRKRGGERQGDGKRKNKGMEQKRVKREEKKRRIGRGGEKYTGSGVKKGEVKCVYNHTSDRLWTKRLLIPLWLCRYLIWPALVSD